VKVKRYGVDKSSGTIFKPFFFTQGFISPHPIMNLNYFHNTYLSDIRHTITNTPVMSIQDACEKQKTRFGQAKIHICVCLMPNFDRKKTQNVSDGGCFLQRNVSLFHCRSHFPSNALKNKT